MSLLDALAKATSGGISALAREFYTRLDATGWANDVTGFGTDRDKTTYTAFGGVQFLADQQLSNLYHGDDLAQRMVDIVPDEMLREGFVADIGDAKKNEELADQLEALGAREKFANAIRWGRLFGAGALLIGADDGRPASSELIPERARGVRYLYELDKRLLYPLSWYNEPGHPKLGQPETYLITPASAQAIGTTFSAVHESRLLMFGGATTGLIEKQANFGYDRSVLQRAFDALRAFNTGWKAVEILLTDGNQSVFKMQGLDRMIGAQGQEFLTKRIQMVDFARSALRAIVVDAGDTGTGGAAPESFERQSVSLTDYPATLDRFMLRLAAAVQIPATILYGQSPAGMNATGESDYRWFNDRIRAQQTLMLAPRIRRLVHVMLSTKSMQAGRESAAIKVTFPSLWREAPSIEATRKKAIAETDQIRILTGELSPEEVAVIRTQPDGWDKEIALTPEGTKAREAVIKDANGAEDDAAAATVTLAPTDIAKVITVNEGRKSQGLGPLLLEGGGEDPDGKLTVAEFTAKREAAAGPASAPFGEGAESRFDANVDLTAELQHHPRAIIAGGPRTGKSTIAVRAGERYGRKVRHADSLVASHAWGDDSKEVSSWFEEAGDWIVEGVSTPRALRKWLAANPDKKLAATVVYLRDAIQVQAKGARAMAKGCDTVWNEIKGELASRGVTVLERDQ